MSRHRKLIAALLISLLVVVVVLPVSAQEPAVSNKTMTRAFVGAGNTRLGISMPILRPSATGVETPEATRTIKIEGTVSETFDELPGYIVVADETILVTDETIIRPTDSVLEIGDYAVVHATVDGELKTATSIYVYKDGPIGDAIEFRGMITEHPPAPFLGNWTVAGQTVIVTDVRAPKGNEPSLGYFAHVVGEVLADQTILAESVDVLRPDEVAGRFEFEGEIQDLGDVPGQWTIGGISAWVEEEVALEGNIVVGAMAQVAGHQTTAGSLVFDQVTVPDASLEPIVICGLIEEISVEDDGYGWWRVDGQVVEIDAQTFVDESHCRAVIGMWAEVVAVPGPFSPYALRIRVERPE